MQSIESLRSIVESSPNAVGRFDREGRCLYVNAAAIRLLARPVDQIVGRTFAELGVPSTTSELWMQRLRGVFESGQPARFHWSRGAGDATIELVADYVPERAEDGTVATVLLYWSAVAQPSSPSPDASRLELAMRLAKVGIWDWDVATDRSVWNDEMLRLYGLRREDFTGKGSDYLAFTHPDYRDAQRANIEKAFHRGLTEAEALANGVTSSPNEICIVRPDGEKRFTVGDALVIVDEQGRPVRMLGVTLDITERKRDGKVREELEERFAKAFRFNPAPMAITTTDGRIVDVNERYEELVGYTIEESRGRNTVELGIWPDDETRMRLVRALQTDGAIHDTPTQLVTKSGERRDVLMSAQTITLAGERCILSFATDVTEQKRLQEQLLQAQKLEAIGRLAGGIAHDFNNLLAVVNGCAEVGLKKVEAGDPLRKELEAIVAAGQRSAELTRQLLAVGRRQVLRPTVLDLGELVRGFEPLVRPVLGEGISLVTKLPSAPVRASADRTQLEQVLMNLVVNARDAMPEGGTVTIEVASNEHVTLAVSDTGEGIDEAVRAHIFEPFFTTKPSGKGTGLGLATVHAIVEQSGGSVEVHGERGRGTTFLVRLPRVAA